MVEKGKVRLKRNIERNSKLLPLSKLRNSPQHCLLSVIVKRNWSSLLMLTHPSRNHPEKGLNLIVKKGNDLLKRRGLLKLRKG